MDFAFTREQEAFRQELREFIRQELPTGWLGPTFYDEEYGEEEFVAMGRKIARRLGERGWLALTWPTEYGGQARSSVEQVIFKEEITYNRVPGVDFQSLGLVAPVLLTYGTEEQRRQHLPGIARGETFWCQGFSEPEAGSDLAALKTRAVEDGDCFVVSGQKVWTTGAHRVDWAILLVRTDPDAPKHRGISSLLVDMKTPGIQIRPLLNVIGSHSFNEVFFDNVRVPKNNLVYEKNQGWRVATSVLNLERSGIDLIGYSRRALDDLKELVRQARVGGRASPQDRLVNHKLAEREIECEVGRLLSYRVAWMQSRRLVPEYEASESRVFGTQLMQRLANTGMQILGLYGQLAKASKWVRLNGDIEQLYVSSLGRTIGGGTSEIQRNTIAIRGLGLPR